MLLTWGCLLLVTGVAQGQGKPASPPHVAEVRYLSTVKMPHHWAVDFVKRGNLLYVTGSESQRKFAVVDASDPRQMKVIAEDMAGMYAARNLCLHDDLSLVNLYRFKAIRETLRL